MSEDLFDRQSDLLSRIERLEREISVLEKESIVHQAALPPHADAENTNTVVDPAAIQTAVADDVDYQQFEAPEWCIPIKANVMTFEFEKLAKEVLPVSCVFPHPPPIPRCNLTLFLWTLPGSSLRTHPPEALR